MQIPGGQPSYFDGQIGTSVYPVTGGHPVPALYTLVTRLGILVGSEKLTGQLKHHRTEQSEGDQVGYGHERVQCIRHQPDEIQGRDCPHRCRDCPQDAKRGNGFDTEQIFDTFLTLKRPAQHGGKCENRQRQVSSLQVEEV